MDYHASEEPGFEAVLGGFCAGIAMFVILAIVAVIGVALL